MPGTRNPGTRPAMRAPLGAMLLLVVLLPSLIFYAGLSTSLALGTSIAALMLVGVAMLSPAARGRLAITPEALAALVVAAITAHLVVACVFQPIDLARASASLIPLALVILGGCALGRLLAAARDADIGRAVRLCFAVLCVVSALPTLGFSPVAPNVDTVYVKPVFPFTEPSHFALVFVPMLMYCCIASSGRRRLLVLLLGALVAALLQNLTLVAGCLLVAWVCLRRLALPVLAAVLGLVATQLDLSYYAERLDFTGDVQNLSNLVYVQGWQLVRESLERSSGWGLGFQQLGLQGSDTQAANIIFALVGNYANVLDGGFTFAKLASEFGVFGLMLAALYLATAWRAIRDLRSTARGAKRFIAPVVFAQCMLASYLIEMFVRGAGYFTGTGILLIASFWLLSWAHQASPAAVVAPRSTGIRRVRRRIVATAALRSRQAGH